MAFILHGLRRLGGSCSIRGLSGLSMNRLPAQKPTTMVVPTTTTSPSVLTMLQQHLFPLRQVTPTPKTTPIVVTSTENGFECLNRNARRGKKANHGKRAVSSARRKEKRRTLWKKNG